MGNTNRQTKNTDARALAAEQKRLAAEAAQKKERRSRAIIIVSVAAAVLILGFLLVYSKLNTNGFFLRHTDSVSGPTITVDNAVVSYFFHQSYQEFINTYRDYLTYFGLDTSKSLKAQACTMTDSGSWFDYFMEGTKSSLTQMLVFAEEAKARGLSLTDSDKKSVEATLSNFTEAAESYGYSVNYYIRSLFGTGMKLDDIRRAIELSTLANKGYNAFVGEYSFTGEDYAKYIEDNPTALLRASYTVMSLATSDGMVEGEVTEEIIDAYAARLAAASSKEEFDSIAYEYLKDVAYKNDTSATEDDIRKEVEDGTVENASYNASSEFSQWLFDSARKAGETYTHTDEGTHTTQVYYVVSPAALDTVPTRTVRHILPTATGTGSSEAASARADEILAQWKAGEATEDSFAALAQEYSEDTSAEDGGLIPNIAEGATVEEFDAWVYDDARRPGDTAVVESVYGFHVMYYVGDGILGWEAEADTALKNAQYQEDYPKLTEKYPITYDAKKLNKIEA